MSELKVSSKSEKRDQNTELAWLWILDLRLLSQCVPMPINDINEHLHHADVTSNEGDHVGKLEPTYF